MPVSFVGGGHQSTRRKPPTCRKSVTNLDVSDRFEDTKREPEDVSRGDRVNLMVFNATFNNISVIEWWSVLLVEETDEPGENQRPAVRH
jgi:hypothetical protein